eukprot:TRINITY_DN11328_c0_g1_i1.p1 TRINITY_DN11328_c0_g1~~TRINITY_DN11328_c0_g1_i1.p1  ORF type:complete len:161 (-),score=17.13 TRINITY_DN11328_c0_g1_i1:16-498(-)
MSGYQDDIQDCLGMVDLSIKELGGNSRSILATRDVNVAFHRKVSSWLRERGYITVSKRGCYVTEKYEDLAGLKEALEKKYKVKRTKALPLLSQKFNRRARSTRTMVGKKQSKKDLNNTNNEEEIGDNGDTEVVTFFGETIPVAEGILLWGADYADIDFEN